MTEIDPDAPRLAAEAATRIARAHRRGGMRAARRAALRASLDQHVYTALVAAVLLRDAFSDDTGAKPPV